MPRLTDITAAAAHRVVTRLANAAAAGLSVIRLAVVTAADTVAAGQMATRLAITTAVAAAAAAGLIVAGQAIYQLDI